MEAARTDLYTGEALDALPTRSEFDELRYAADLARGGFPGRATRVLDANAWLRDSVHAAEAAVDGLMLHRTRRSDCCKPGEATCSACRKDEAWHGRLPQGKFYKSSLVEASLTSSLEDGTFGQVNLGTSFPLPISISTNYGPARAKVSSAHELAHVANQLFKLGLSHPQVHELGVFYATEGVPMLNALEAAVDGGGA
jgi:hypothetical protein